MPLFPENVEETHGAGLELRVLDAKLRQPLLNEARQPPGLGDTAQVPFHIGHKTRYAGLAEGLGQHLQRYGFTRTRGTGNEAVPAQHVTVQGNGPVRGMGHVQPAFFVQHKLFSIKSIIP